MFAIIIGRRQGHEKLQEMGSPNRANALGSRFVLLPRRGSREYVYGVVRVRQGRVFVKFYRLLPCRRVVVPQRYATGNGGLTMGSNIDILVDKLNRIEQLSLIGAKSILTLDEAVVFTGLSKQYLYRLTSNREIPHFKKCRKLYFKKSELEEWLLERKIPTRLDIDSMASTYVATH